MVMMAFELPAEEAGAAARARYASITGGQAGD
jgi:hypothetical protein